MHDNIRDVIVQNTRLSHWIFMT